MTQETKEILENYYKNFSDACSLKTLQVYSKRLNYKQVEINSLLAKMSLDLDVLDDEMLSSFSKNARKQCYKRVTDRISLLERYMNTFENEPCFFSVLDDVRKQYAEIQPILVTFAVELENSLN